MNAQTEIKNDHYYIYEGKRFENMKELKGFTDFNSNKIRRIMKSGILKKYERLQSTNTELLDNSINLTKSYENKNKKTTETKL